MGKKCEYQKCMEAITVDEVFEAVSSALSLKQKQADEKLTKIGIVLDNKVSKWSIQRFEP